MKKILLTAFWMAAVLASNAQTLTDSLKVYIRFNGNTDDVSGNGNHGIPNGPTLNPYTCDFFGNDNIILPHLFIFSTQYTYSLWFKVTAPIPDNTKMVLLSVGAADCEQSIHLTREFSGSNGLTAQGHHQIGSTYSANSVNIPAENFWTHVVSVKNMDSVFIYVDGQLVQGVPTVAQVPCYAGANPKGVLGADVKLNQNFQGTMAAVRIYNRALKANEVNNLFNLNILSSKPVEGIDYKLFPNPVSNRQLTLQTPAEVNTVKVFDLVGKEIGLSYDSVSGLITVDNSVSAGTYLLTITTDRGVISERIVVQ